MISALKLSPAPATLSAHGGGHRRRMTGHVRPHGQKPAPPGGGGGGTQSENSVLKVAWYGSELLGIAASFFRPSPGSAAEWEREQLIRGEEEVSGALDRAQVVAAIKDDFQRSYFVTGNLTLYAYEENCEFADPAGSFRGLNRFKRNCSNFGALLVKSNMKLTKWEEFEEKGVGHWRFSCIMSFPWRPILSGIQKLTPCMYRWFSLLVCMHLPATLHRVCSLALDEIYVFRATGYTEYYFDADSGKVCRHVEHWNVPKMALLKQIFRPTRWVWGKS